MVSHVSQSEDNQHRQKTDQETGAETRIHGQGQKASQVHGDTSIKECWRVVHDSMTIWQSWLKEGWVIELPGGTGETNDVD